ncbi:MAG TPA: HD domain-containing protein [Candidatus Sulfotelmatobacter sp.]|nr:HD domain-containing protein [Candidatus Sulfotelmatobacter sp.]
MGEFGSHGPITERTSRRFISASSLQWPIDLIQMDYEKGSSQDRRFLFQPVELGTPFEHEIWRSVGGLTIRVLGEQAAQILPRLQPHWRNFATVDRGIPPDQRMASHGLRVARLLQTWGIIAGFDPYEIDILSLSGFLHDIGKGMLENPYANPADRRCKYQDLLLSDTFLTDEQQKRMVGHTTDGYTILHNVGLPNEFAEVALDHHTTRLKPMSTLSQMVSIADDTDIVTHARTYKDAEPRSILRNDRIINEKLERLAIPSFTQAYRKWINAAPIRSQ